MDTKPKVGLIGAGVMGEALISALVAYGLQPHSITISEKRLDRTDELRGKYSINSSELAANVSTAEVLLLVVKPQDLSSVLTEIKEHLAPETLVVTFAAGKTTSFINEGVGKPNPVIRVMPNSPILLGKGMSAISSSHNVTSGQRDFVKGFLSAAGKTIEVEESLQDAVTATSGSGPAYFFAFVEAMVAGAVDLGLNQKDATTLTVQTIIGAAKMLEESGESASTLRENVTSLKGTTAAALASFTTDGLEQLVSNAMKAARDRAQELA
jgi:pyrroline-5-carboxylate reductase